MISREELYKLVWAEPMTKVASRFDVSGSYLARMCTLLNVPRPERGYWAKMAVGKAPPQPPLPAALPGDPLDWSKEGERLPVAKAERRKLPEPPVPTGKKPSIPRDRTHGLIRGAKAHFEKTRQIEEWDYLKPYKKLLVDVVTSSEGLDKGLSLANDLFNALESIGYRVVMAPTHESMRRINIDTPAVDYWHHTRYWSPYRPTVVYVGSIAIGLIIFEYPENATLRYLNGKYVRDTAELERRHSRNSYRSWTTTRELPSGRFRIFAYSPYHGVNLSRTWDETKAASLRPKLKAIAQEIEAMAPKLAQELEKAEREAEIRHQQWLIEEDRRKREEDKRRIRQSEVESDTDLRTIIGTWSEVVGVERFLAGVEQRAEQLSPDVRLRVQDRLALARQFLGTQDPLDFFLNWRTPVERYQPRYPEND